MGTIGLGYQVQVCVVALSPLGHDFQWLGLLESITSTTMWSLISILGNLHWLQRLLVPQQHFCVQWLGTRAGSGSG